MNTVSKYMKHRMALVGSLLLSLAFAWSSSAEPVKVIFDTDMITDFDDVGALACLHALADAGECEILATISSTRGNASVGAVEVINHYYGRPDIPVGAPKGMGVMGAHPGAKTKVDPSAPLGEKTGNDGGHYKYRGGAFGHRLTDPFASGWNVVAENCGDRPF